MGSVNTKREARMKRKRRIRKKIMGAPERPRMSIFRSARHIYVQIIDDTVGNTLVAASSTEQTVTDQPKFENKSAMARYVGKLAGQRALEKGIAKVVLDRNGFLYHGRIKALSEGARESGLDF